VKAEHELKRWREVLRGDPLNRLTKVTDPLAGITEFTYDPNGNLLTVKDARNNITEYTYNNMERLATRKDPLLRTETYNTYDNKGNLTQFIDRKSQVTNYQYDPLNRRKKATYHDTSTTDYVYDERISHRRTRPKRILNLLLCLVV
jgi:YD repeat-containing protein